MKEKIKLAHTDGHSFSLKEIELICSYAEQEIETIITFAIWTGINLRKIFSLRWSDIHKISNNINVIFVPCTKYDSIGKHSEYGRTYAEILYDPAIKALEQQKKHTSDDGFIFKNPMNGKLWNYTSFRREWGKTLGKAGLEYRKLSLLRYTHMELMLKANIDFYPKSKLGRYSQKCFIICPSIESTYKYGQTKINDLLKK